LEEMKKVWLGRAAATGEAARMDAAATMMARRRRRSAMAATAWSSRKRWRTGDF
jgi:hypothetical protein